VWWSACGGKNSNVRIRTPSGKANSHDGLRDDGADARRARGHAPRSVSGGERYCSGVPPVSAGAAPVLSMKIVPADEVEKPRWPVVPTDTGTAVA